jgi:catechol 2,3-dioxygenase-like lactoylglutathione lyase family enzyme
MSGEISYAILPAEVLDESIAFYEVLGFTCTYRQRRPNPCAVVERDDLGIHLAEIPGFDPEQSYGSVIVVVPDADALYASFAASLRAAYGKLPSAGIPRILRPRKRLGTVRGFSVVDPGGNWLRISTMGQTEEAARKERTTGLAKVVDHAARQGDARGDDREALAVIERGLVRFADAPDIVRVRAFLYRAELAVRTGDRALAETSLAAASAVELSSAERAAVADEHAHAEEVVAGS